MKNINEEIENEKAWEDFFEKREEVLNNLIWDEKKEEWKMTAKQKESFKEGYNSLEEALRALRLREDLHRIYNRGSATLKFFKRLECYLNPQFENIEYELSNNGCINLLGCIEDELKHDDENYWLENIKRDIENGYYENNDDEDSEEEEESEE